MSLQLFLLLLPNNYRAQHFLSDYGSEIFPLTQFPKTNKNKITEQSSMLKTAPTSIAAVITIVAASFFLYNPPSKPSYHSLFLSLVDNVSISNHLYTLTRRPHVAGSQANAEAADYVISIFNSSNLVSHIASYEVLLTYPQSRSLTLTPPPPENPIVFNLRQETYDGDPYADVANEVTPTFHAYAKSGTVAGAVVYVNYGRPEDYGVLKEMGVNVTGNIVLARYGKIFRGDIVQNAYEEGAIGALLYTDKKDYGGGERWFPESKWMPPTGVQVGTVYGGLGDPSTPGWASSGECERLSEDEIEKRGDVPLIPSLPISAADGEAILRSIRGKAANEDWQGREDAPLYRVGPGPGIVNLNYSGENVIRTIQNVIGLIEGEEEPDRFVLLGNHRDAWTYGAVDPNSGTAALLEVAQRLGKLREKGWKPRRTIVFCNWDAEEYGLIGSAEWVEENRELLASRAVAYINVDSAVYEPRGFVASATPQLDELLKQASQLVTDPDNSSQTVYDSWFGTSESKTKIGRLGSGQSDFAAFLQHVGIPAVDMSYGEGYPVYHSMYDDFEWMKNYGDPLFQRHVAVASIWGLVTLRLADEEFLPFNYLSYAYELQKYAEDLRDAIRDKEISLPPLFKAIKELAKAANKIKDQIKALEESKGWLPMSKRSFAKVRELNDRLIMAERAFTDDDGLFGRSWYKHLIYGPSKHDDYGSISFPGIYDAVEEAEHNNSAEAWQFVQHQVWRVARAIKHASLVLNGELT